VHTAGKLFIWEKRNSGRYEHARACHERARARRARNNPPAFTTIIFVRVLRVRVRFCA
jgi:hypothetical protein